MSSSQDSSISGLVSTLVPTAIYAGVYLSIFLVLRRSQRRFYAPRTYLGTLREQERTPELPSGLFNWVGAFFKISDNWPLLHQSLDAFFFLRIIKISVIICFVGCCITWPVLFPVNATGGGGATQLNILTFSNINTDNSAGKNRLYAHCFIAWLFYGFVLYMIIRETIFYINVRQAFLLAPSHANRMSARTVLFTAVPEPYLNEVQLRKVFGKSVKRVWFPGDTDELDDLVKQRDKAAFRLEKAEVKLIKLANKERNNAIKKGAEVTDEEPTIEGESGSVAARWVPAKKRPTHRLGPLGLWGKKVDSINWAREELTRLIPEVDAAQAKFKAGDYQKHPAVFIEFFTQSEAQVAFQTLAHHQALHMAPRYIGVSPNEVVWSSLKVSWWQRVARRYAVQGFIAALIIFWAIPVAVVGLISNVPYLEDNISWLAWLKDIPDVIMGVVTGLLPSVALAILMSLVPIIMRLCAKLSGEPTLARVELFTQNSYFIFQVVQVFLVATLSSAATAVVTQIIDDPTSATSLLANYLPRAANLYYSFFIVQGLGLASSVLAQVVGFFIFRLIYVYLTGTPRAMYNKWTQLSALSWGSLLPVFINIVVIAITYAPIAPLVGGFATLGLGLYYLAYRYNILFVTDTQIDTKGLIYPRALQQLMTGVYLSEVCIIGLFAIATSIGPLVLMIIFLVFTVLVHYAMNKALSPLLASLPKTLEAEEESVRAELEAGSDGSKKEGDAAIVETNGQPSNAPTKKPSFLMKFFKPHIYAEYSQLRDMVPQGFVDYNNLYTEEIEKNAYFPPSVTSETPLLWIPRDPAGVSAQEVAHTNKIIPITDEGSSLDEKCKIVWDPDSERPPIWSEKVYY